MQAAAGICKAATGFATQEVANAMSEWWSQPAINAAPWVTCESCCILCTRAHFACQQVSVFMHQSDLAVLMQMRARMLESGSAISVPGMLLRTRIFGSEVLPNN